MNCRSVAFALVAFFLSTGLETGAADPETIKRAVEAGVAYLKQKHRDNGTWDDTEIGATALPCLALLEAGVSQNDPSVQKGLAAVRRAVPPLRHNYSLSLCILLLDCINDPRDSPLIESMGVRLLAGQLPNGGWNYYSPAVPDDEVRRLTALLKGRSELVVTADLPKSQTQSPVPGLSPEARQALATMVSKRDPTQSTGDNSNTQFAVLGLWAARRYGVPVDGTLGKVNLRFREGQHPDGGWQYHHVPARDVQRGTARISSPSMTCAGLLGIAAGYGASAEASMRTNGATRPGAARSAVASDASVRAGLTYLASWTNDAAAATVERDRKLCYFLWSLERVAVAYDLPTIGGKDWHAWGSDVLVRKQAANGSWDGGIGPTTDTALALLFLRRSNLTPDLTALLKGQLRDPGERVLKAGTVASDKTPVEVQQLVSDLTSAETARQQRALENLRDGKGPEYTEGLAEVIGKLDGTLKGKAREALTDRLSRMTLATLRGKLAEGNAEVRRAAALASAVRDERELIPEVLKLLEDRNEDVIRAARAALRAFSGEDFGPQPGAGPAARAEAVKAWRAWWEKHRRK